MAGDIDPIEEVWRGFPPCINGDIQAEPVSWFFVRGAILCMHVYGGQSVLEGGGKNHLVMEGAVRLELCPPARWAYIYIYMHSDQSVLEGKK